MKPQKRIPQPNDVWNTALGFVKVHSITKNYVYGQVRKTDNGRFPLGVKKLPRPTVFNGEFVKALR